MATAEEMAAYTKRLHAHTSAQNKPVTEIIVFKLNPEYVNNHEAAATEFKSQIISQTTPGAPHAMGILRMAWGFSTNDPGTLVWMLDWEKIQDHWVFWQTPGFPPLIGAITKLFVPGRPLVRHYDFGGQGLLPRQCEWARVFVWNEGRFGTGAEEARGRVLKSRENGKYGDFRQGYAVDVEEMTWYCLLLGYGTEQEARSEEVVSQFPGEDHVVRLEYF